MTSRMNRLAQERSPYLRQHAANPVDWYPWGSDAFERNMTLGLMENEARTLHQIEDALEQMEGGRYGVCILCGQAIPLPRLEALPFATTCVPCQEKAERRL